tara:strand:- start:105 stop:332 length:228 start_codon:yes stop_codon:yes gene_type:complete
LGGVLWLGLDSKSDGIEDTFLEAWEGTVLEPGKQGIGLPRDYLARFAKWVEGGRSGIREDRSWENVLSFCNVSDC